MAEKKNLLTREGLEKLENELRELTEVRMAEIAEKIKEAREQGDLSENAEYDAAKDEQRDVKARIDEITEILKNAEVVDDEDAEEVDGEVVQFGSTVEILDMQNSKIRKYKIVGSVEANVLNGLISNESPLGVALQRKKVNDIVTVEAPRGMFEYKILGIEK